MSENEKPLHVRVAEALGWIGCAYRRAPVRTISGTFNCPGWYGIPPGYDGLHPVDQYDGNWMAAGPEIVRLGISLAPDQTMPGTWGAWVGDFAPFSARASHPLVAVCELIVALKAAGRQVAA